jgi:hypothetical protein
MKKVKKKKKERQRMTVEPFSQLKTLVLSNESILNAFIEQISKIIFMETLSERQF